MLTLGFTNHYYTLWSVTESNRTDEYGCMWGVSSFNYQQNLSMDYDTAIRKIEAISHSRYNIDLDLRGSSSFVTERMIKDFTDDQFTFGKLISQCFSKTEDVWQLTRAMNKERGAHRKVNARKRLIELGELKRYSWVEKYFDENLAADYNNRQDCMVERKRSHCPIKMIQKLELMKKEQECNGHFFNPGDKVIVMIKKVGSFSFDSAFGTTFVEKYMTEDGKMLKYMGASPLEISEDKFVKVKGTVKHDSYRGPETKLQRMKIL